METKPWHIATYDENVQSKDTAVVVGTHTDAVVAAERMINGEPQWSYQIVEVPQGPATIETYVNAPEVWCDECGDLTRFDSWTEAEEYAFQHNVTTHADVVRRALEDYAR